MWLGMLENHLGKKDKLLNYNSIGIEISNPGHEHGYKKFSNKQIKCLIKLLNFLIKKYKINKKKYIRSL